MEIINPNSLPGGNARSCGSEALQPPHLGGEGGCSHGNCGFIPPECDAACSYNAG